MTGYVVGIDLGTSACKVIALDDVGNITAKSVRDYPSDTPRPGWAEQDPSRWWATTDTCVQDVLAALPNRSEVRGFGLCGQMHGLTALDEDGQVIRPAILWNDQRAAAQCDEITELAGGLPSLLRLVQNRMLPGFTAGKILWLRQHEPQHYARMRHFLNPKDYLRLRMTGDYATDVSEASGTGLFDVRNRAWSWELMSRLDIEPALVPRVVESHERTGTLLPGIARKWGLPEGTPVFGGGGDAVLQTTSMGIIGAGALGVTLGTAGIVAGASASCPEHPDGRLQISCGNIPGGWHVMGVSLAAGGAFQWLRDALRPLAGDSLAYDTLVQLAQQAPPGAEDLLFLPYLQGERCPHVAPDGRGTWIGLTSRHSAAHLSRSVMEGVLLNVREIVAVCKDTGLDCTHVRLSGGVTAEPLWQRLLADVLQTEVATVIGAAEGGAFGAALLAGVGTGWWNTLSEALGVVTETEPVVPDITTAAVYGHLYEVHRHLFDTLDATFGELAGAGSKSIAADSAAA
jgi:xylulokinase